MTRQYTWVEFLSEFVTVIPKIEVSFNWRPFALEERGQFRATVGEGCFESCDQAELKSQGIPALPAGVPAIATFRVPVSDISVWDLARVSQALDAALATIWQNSPTPAEAPAMIVRQTPGCLARGEVGPYGSPVAVLLADFLKKFSGALPPVSIAFNWAPVDASARKSVREMGGEFSPCGEYEVPSASGWYLPAGFQPFVTFRVPVSLMQAQDKRTVVRAMRRALRVAIANRPTQDEAPAMVTAIPPKRAFLLHCHADEHQRDLERLTLHTRYLLNAREIAFLEAQEPKAQPITPYNVQHHIGHDLSTEDQMRAVIHRSYEALHLKPLLKKGDPKYEPWIIQYRCQEDHEYCGGQWACRGKIVHVGPDDSSHTRCSHKLRLDQWERASAGAEGGAVAVERGCRYLQHWYERAKRLLWRSDPPGRVQYVEGWVEDIASGLPSLRKLRQRADSGEYLSDGIWRQNRGSPGRLSAREEADRAEIDAAYRAATQVAKKEAGEIQKRRAEGAYRRVEELEAARRALARMEQGEAPLPRDKDPLPSEPLPRSAMRTLAGIARWQPVSQADLESRCGCPVSRALRSLLERDLIRPVRPVSGAGRPLLYETTDTFLKRYGLTGLKDLPSTLKDTVNHLALVEARLRGEPSPEFEEHRQSDPTYREKFQAVRESLELGAPRSRYDPE